MSRPNSTAQPAAEDRRAHVDAALGFYAPPSADETPPAGLFAAAADTTNERTAAPKMDERSDR